MAIDGGVLMGVLAFDIADGGARVTVRTAGIEGSAASTRTAAHGRTSFTERGIERKRMTMKPTIVWRRDRAGRGGRWCCSHGSCAIPPRPRPGYTARRFDVSARVLPAARRHRNHHVRLQSGDPGLREIRIADRRHDIAGARWTSSLHAAMSGHHQQRRAGSGLVDGAGRADAYVRTPLYRAVSAAWWSAGGCSRPNTAGDRGEPQHDRGITDSRRAGGVPTRRRRLHVRPRTDRRRRCGIAPTAADRASPSAGSRDRARGSSETSASALGPVGLAAGGISSPPSSSR